MLEFIFAVLLIAFLASFLLVNLHNILVVHRRRGHAKIYEKVRKPSGFTVAIAGVGTLVYFLEIFLYLFLVLGGFTSLLYDSPCSLRFLWMFYIQIIGVILTAIGYSIFCWSVIARGQYAASWQMPENQRLVMWGPYRYVRHPSYLSYFLMFFGLFFIWPNLFTLFPLLAIPGYCRVSSEEEKLLVQRFGDEYSDYQKRTGRFLPKRR